MLIFSDNYFNFIWICHINLWFFSPKTGHLQCIQSQCKTSLFIWQLSQKCRKCLWHYHFPHLLSITKSRRLHMVTNVFQIHPPLSIALHMCAVAKSCLTLCNSMDCSLPGSSVHGIFSREYWTGLPSSPLDDLPDPGIGPKSPVSLALAGRFFASEPPGNTLYLYNVPVYSLASHLDSNTDIPTGFSVSPMPYMNPFSIVKPDQALREKHKSDLVTLQVFVGWMNEVNFLQILWRFHGSRNWLLSHCCIKSSIQV